MCQETKLGRGLSIVDAEEACEDRLLLLANQLKHAPAAKKEDVNKGMHPLHYIPFFNAKRYIGGMFYAIIPALFPAFCHSAVPTH